MLRAFVLSEGEVWPSIMRTAFIATNGEVLLEPFVIVFFCFLFDKNELFF